MEIGTWAFSSLTSDKYFCMQDLYKDLPEFAAYSEKVSDPLDLMQE